MNQQQVQAIITASGELQKRKTQPSLHTLVLSGLVADFVVLFYGARNFNQVSDEQVIKALQTFAEYVNNNR